jgi:Small-conductance mechanosensitive channel
MLKTSAMEKFSPYIFAFIVCAAGIVGGNVLGHAVGRVLRKHAHMRAQLCGAIQKTVRFSIMFAALLGALSLLNVNLNAVLGAAGIFGVAIGLASQTSLSNIICGVFLVIERPFKIGDIVEAEGSLGVVDSVGFLATFIRGFDNRLVRIPNENMMKTKIINITNFPTRRIDMPISAAYAEDPARVMRLLRETCDANADCLKDPEPLVMFTGVGKTSIDFTVCAWVERTQFVKARNSLLCDIKACFERERVTPAYPPVVAHLNVGELELLQRDSSK